jgi:streptogramin lyase
VIPALVADGRTCHQRFRAASLGVSTALLASLIVSCSATPGLHGRSGPSSSHAPTRTGIVGPSPFAGFIDPVGIVFDAGGQAWVADYREDNLTSFPPSDLAARGRAHLQPSKIVSSVGGPNQIRFDARGTLWVAGWDRGVIRGYASSALQGASPRPTVTITGPDLSRPTDIAFDSTGRMWVANQGTGEILSFAPGQIGRTGQPTPAVVLRLPGFGQDTPEALAFDRRGRLWVSSYYDDLVIGLAPNQLSTGTHRPAFRLRLPSGSGPIGLTVDLRGQLWVAEASRNSVVAFDINEFAQSSPIMRLTGTDIKMPHTVTFDGAGSAWLPCYNGTLVRFDASRLRPGTIDGPDLVVG